MSLGRTRLADYSIGATVLFVAIALPFYVFTRAEHLHRLDARTTAATTTAAPQGSPVPTTVQATSPQASSLPQTLPLTAGTAAVHSKAAARKGIPGQTTPTSAPTDSATATPAPDAPPVVAFSVTPQAGASPLTVTVDASGSTDTDQTPISLVIVDFGDGTSMLADAHRQASHTYTTSNTYTITVRVTDTAKNTASASTTIVVS